MKTARPRHPRAGLTLIEVLLALTIIGLGVSILVVGAARALTVARRAYHYTTAQHLLALVDLEQPVVTAAELADDAEEGEFAAPYERYRWSRTAEVFGPEQDQIYLVRTRVSWSERGAENHEETLTLVRDQSQAAAAGGREGTSSSASDGAASGAAAAPATAVRAGMRVLPPSASRGNRRGLPGEGANRRNAGRGDTRPGGGDARAMPEGAPGRRWRPADSGGGGSP